MDKFRKYIVIPYLILAIGWIAYLVVRDPSIAGIVSPYSSEYTEKQELNSYCNQLPNKCK